MGTTLASRGLRLSSTRLALSAAALFVLAGTPAAIGQGAPTNPTSKSSSKSSGKATATPTPAPSDMPGSSPSPTAAPKAKPTPKIPGINLKDGHKADSGADKSLKIDDQMVVDLHVQDEDLANVLEMLSIQSQKNIVSSRNVSARITANLYGVTFYEALDAILHANGYGYVEKGNFIYVYTLEELEQIEAASKARISKVIRLNYLNAIDAAEFVKPLLSEGGQIKTNGKTGTFPAITETPISGDDFANSATLVVYDFEENINEIDSMLKSLDTKPAQILVEATILQTKLTEDNAFGVDFSLIGDMNFQDFVQVGGPLGATQGLIKGVASSGGSTALPVDGVGQAITSTPGNTSGPGTMKLGMVGGDLAVFIKMLDEVTDTTVLSNPKILALNRMPSRVLVGTKVGYLSTTSTDTTTTQTVQFLNTGTQLYFRPFVTNENMIRMELKPQVSTATIRDSSDSNGAKITIPDEDTQELVTNVIVGDGQTVVLGGLFRENTKTTKRQVPFLGDIPLVGLAFRGHEDEIRREEYIFMITPSIVNEQTLTAQGQRAADGVERVVTGARAGTLFFSRAKITGMFNVEASKLAANGENDRALWKIEQSLWMAPEQQDAIALREKITGKVKPLPGRSLLQDIVRGEAVYRTHKPSTIVQAPQQDKDLGFPGEGRIAGLFTGPWTVGSALPNTSRVASATKTAAPRTTASVAPKTETAQFVEQSKTSTTTASTGHAHSDSFNTASASGNTSSNFSNNTNSRSTTKPSEQPKQPAFTQAFPNTSPGSASPQVGSSGGRFAGLVRWSQVVATAPQNWNWGFTTASGVPMSDSK